jgi:hypothetical protein
MTRTEYVSQSIEDSIAQNVTGQFAPPEFLRLPKPGRQCPFTGMSRSALNMLILPTPQNDHKPPVRSFCMRQRGAKTGIRLIDYASLRTHILRHAEGGAE